MPAAWAVSLLVFLSFTLLVIFKDAPTLET